MGNNDFTWFFIFMSLFNTNLGMTNVEKNDEQYNRQIRIEEKIDKLINLLEEKNDR